MEYEKDTKYKQINYYYKLALRHAAKQVYAKSMFKVTHLMKFRSFTKRLRKNWHKHPYEAKRRRALHHIFVVMR